MKLERIKNILTEINYTFSFRTFVVLKFKFKKISVNFWPPKEDLSLQIWRWKRLFRLNVKNIWWCLKKEIHFYVSFLFWQKGMSQNPMSSKLLHLKNLTFNFYIFKVKTSKEYDSFRNCIIFFFPSSFLFFLALQNF